MLGLCSTSLSAIKKKKNTVLPEKNKGQPIPAAALPLPSGKSYRTRDSNCLQMSHWRKTMEVQAFTSKSNHGLTMLAALFLCLALCEGITIKAEIRGSARDSLILPCIFNEDPKENLNHLTVCWERSGEVVHSYHQLEDHPEYQNENFKGRTRLFESELENRNASLLLMNLTKADEGEYKCTVHVNHVYRNVVNISIIEFPEQEYEAKKREQKNDVKGERPEQNIKGIFVTIFGCLVGSVILLLITVLFVRWRLSQRLHGTLSQRKELNRCLSSQISS
ncbi:uncharacterized protein LOC135357559 isoform X2 [Latimeria chalumnae]|uniref:uncharacterized protein LOC135357559 isoform X2 n=1 Tax=Latimeria chalumnae TaxID=7897 RepID=UPI00313C944D